MVKSKCSPNYSPEDKDSLYSSPSFLLCSPKKEEFPLSLTQTGFISLSTHLQSRKRRAGAGLKTTEFVFVFSYWNTQYASIFSFNLIPMFFIVIPRYRRYPIPQITHLILLKSIGQDLNLLTGEGLRETAHLQKPKNIFNQHEAWLKNSFYLLCC